MIRNPILPGFNPDSGGIWAPCLSHADGLFWLVYTDVKRIDGSFKDTQKYIVTSPTIKGAWSRPVKATHHRFDGTDLPIEFQWLRTPQPERLFSLTGAALRSQERKAPGSWFEQSLVARRHEHHRFRAETTVNAAPPNYQQTAGLITYDNRHKFHAAMVTLEPDLGRCVTIFSCPGNRPADVSSFTHDPT